MDSKIITIKEIARQLNISPSTVSRALHDHKSIGLRTKTQVQQLAKELNLTIVEVLDIFNKILVYPPNDENYVIAPFRLNLFYNLKNLTLDFIKNSHLDLLLKL